MPRRTRQIVSNQWPAWMYGPNGEASVFNSAEEVPFGYTHRPGELFIPPPPTGLDRDALLAEAEEKGIEVHPAWGNAHLRKVLDNDGSTSW